MGQLSRLRRESRRLSRPDILSLHMKNTQRPAGFAERDYVPKRAENLPKNHILKNPLFLAKTLGFARFYKPPRDRFQYERIETTFLLG